MKEDKDIKNAFKNQKGKNIVNFNNNKKLINNREDNNNNKIKLIEKYNKGKNIVVNNNNALVIPDSNKDFLGSQQIKLNEYKN